MRFILTLTALVAVLASLPATAAERIFNFSDFALDRSPTNFTSLVAGRGRPGDWRIIMDQVPPALTPLTARAPAVSARAVLAQQAREPLAAHIPLLISDDATFNDFKFTTRLKITGGVLAQSAGLVFRFQNASNFFVVQAGVLRGTFRCSKVVNGEMKPPLGPEVALAKGEWHELSVQCEGPRITCSLDGSEQIKLVDNSAAGLGGKIGFCTQADTTAYFADAKVTFTPLESLAKKMVRDTLQEFSRLVGVKIFAVRPPGTGPVVIAGANDAELGTAAGETAANVIKTGHSYYGKTRETVMVMLPLRDHNGDIVAAVSIEMKKNIGQTEDNALARAQPIIRRMQTQVQSLEDLLE